MRHQVDLPTRAGWVKYLVHYLAELLRQGQESAVLTGELDHGRAELVSECQLAGGSAWSGLPDADDVAGGVADGGYPEVSFRVGRGDQFGAVSGRCAKGVIEVGDVDVGQHAGLSGGGKVGAPVPDDVAGAVAEARRVRPAAQLQPNTAR